jgi:hypothetical protein
MGLHAGARFLRACEPINGGWWAMQQPGEERGPHVAPRWGGRSRPGGPCHGVNRALSDATGMALRGTGMGVVADLAPTAQDVDGGHAIRQGKIAPQRRKGPAIAVKVYGGKLLGVIEARACGASQGQGGSNRRCPGPWRSWRGHYRRASEADQASWARASGADRRAGDRRSLASRR